MPKEFLKMADAFAHDSVETLERHIYDGHMSKHCCEYAAHAINSHDELVRQRDELKEVLQDLMDWTVRNVDAPDCEPYNRATRLLNQIGD